MVFTIPDIFAKSKAGEGAREYFTLHGLPNRRNEEFHYTDLSRALQNVSDSKSVFIEYPAPKHEIEIRLLSNRIAVYGEPKSIDLFESFDTIPNSLIGKLLFGMANDTKTIKIAANCEIVISLIRFCGSRAALNFEIGENSKVTLLEKSEGDGGLSSLYLCVSQCAKSNFTIHSELGFRDGTDLVEINANLQEMTAFDSIFTSNGGRTMRRNIEIEMNGEASKAEIKGVYVLNKSHFDLSSNIVHSAPNCESHTKVRGIANEGAQAVFQGKIMVAKGSNKTIGNMEHRGIMIEDGARIFAKPNLEIYNDDVECSHANTIGAIDESALFYMQSRGISKARAKTLLTHAFLSSVFDDVEDVAEINANLEALLEEMLND